MKASHKRFIARIATVVMGIVSFLLLDAVLEGSLSILGGLALIPACLVTTSVLWQLSLRRLPKKRAARQPQAAVPKAAAPLRVVEGGKSGTKPPHAA